MNAKRIIIPLLVCVLLTAIPAQAATDAVFPKNHWAYSDFSYMSQKGFLPPDIDANPASVITRREILEILSLMTGLVADVNAFIGLSGEDSSTITRQELFCLTGQYLKVTGRVFADTGVAPEFSDWEDLADRARPSAELLASAGILSGKGGNALFPLDSATLAETVKVLAQTEQKTVVFPEALPIVYDEVTRVDAQNGTTGEITTITDRGNIAEIFEIINNASYTFERQEDIPGRGGWSMRVRIYKNDVTIFDYTVGHGIRNSCGQHRMDTLSETLVAEQLREYWRKQPR
jgi:hypothetical protein